MFRTKRMNSMFDPVCRGKSARSAQTSAEFRSNYVFRQKSEYGFWLCLFDLDGTLLRTDDLKQFRGLQYRERPGDIPGYAMSTAYHAALLKAFDQQPDRRLYTPDQLTRLGQCLSGLKIGIVTRAPRHYTSVLLNKTYPSVEWDVIVTCEDLALKPEPGDGIRKAMQKAGLSDASNVVLVGSQQEHLDAGYHAGCWVTQMLEDTVTGEASAQGRAPERAPDAVLRGYRDLVAFLRQPGMFLPELDAVDEFGKENPQPRRIELSFTHPTSGTDHGKTRVVALGRYFASSLPERSAWHASTCAMIAFKKSPVFPAAWIQVLRTAVTRLADQLSVPLVITVIPSKPGNPRRLETLLSSLRAALKGYRSCEFVDDVFQYSVGAKSQHGVKTTRADRYANIGENCRLQHPERIQHRIVLVIDDIVTTGATLVWARTTLLDSGARKVFCLALAKAVSSMQE